MSKAEKRKNSTHETAEKQLINQALYLLENKFIIEILQ